MNRFTVEIPAEDWVWICEFLSEVINMENGKDYDYSEEDREKLRSVLSAMEQAE